MLWQVKKMVTIGVGVGLFMAVASYLSDRSVAAALSGICGAISAIAVQTGLWFRRSFTVKIA